MRLLDRIARGVLVGIGMLVVTTCSGISYTTEDFWVLPDPLRVLECGIHKDASATFRQLFFDVMTKINPDPSAVTAESIACRNNWDDEECIDLIYDPSWFKLAVVREPIERLVSGFLDRCARPAKPDIKCDLFRFESLFGPRDGAAGAWIVGALSPNGSDDAYEEVTHSGLTHMVTPAQVAVREAVKEDMPAMFKEYAWSIVKEIRNAESPGDACHMNHHFAPQTCGCGFRDASSLQNWELVWIHDLKYDYLERNFLGQLSDRPDFEMDALRTVTRLIFDKEEIVVPENSTDAEMPKDHTTDSGSMLALLVSPELEAALHEVFGVDYDLLGHVWEGRQRR